MSELNFPGSDGADIKIGRDDLERENARLQARVEEAEQEIKQLENEADVVTDQRDRYKAQAERVRREVAWLETACVNEDKSFDMFDVLERFSAAIAASPEEAREKEKR